MSRPDIRTYEPAEANAALPQVRRLVERIVEASRGGPDIEEQAKLARYHAQRPGAGPEARAALERIEVELREGETALASAVIALEEMGVHLKDAREGLVDFLAYRDGELVELCWKLGEESVAHWHRIGEGFRGRRPL